MRSLSELVAQVKDEQGYIVVRERTHRNTAESTNARVKWWSIFQLLVLVGEGMFQVWWLKRFFEVSLSAVFLQGRRPGCTFHLTTSSGKARRVKISSSFYSSIDHLKHYQLRAGRVRAYVFIVLPAFKRCTGRWIAKGRSRAALRFRRENNQYVQRSSSLFRHFECFHSEGACV